MPPKRARDRKRQTKLDFSKASPVAVAAAKPSPVQPVQSTPSRVANCAPVKASKNSLVYSSSDDELQAQTSKGSQSGMPVKGIKNVVFGGLDADVASSSSDTSSSESEAEEEKAPVSRKRRRARDSSDEDEDKAKITVIRSKRMKRQSPVAQISAEEDVHVQPRKKQRRNTRTQSKPVEEPGDHASPRSTRRKTARKQSTPVEEILEQPPPRSKRRRIAVRQPSTPVEDEDIEEADQEDQEDQEEQEEQGDESGVDTEVDNEEQDELKEELAFLRSSPPPDRGRLRSTHERPKNERQKALEALKKRRAGIQEPSSDRATPGRSRRIVVESSSDSELEVIKEEPGGDLGVINDDSSDESDDDSASGNSDGEEEPRRTNVFDMFQEDENDANFIDDDPDALIGAPEGDEPDAHIPLEFSSLSRAKPKELFKFAVEWMVMKKIHPAFESKSDLYNLTFRKLDDEVNGLANSKFTSSAWTSDFSRAVRARPELMVMEISRGLRDIGDAHCEACNRRNHPATWELMLQGTPYDKNTLEPVENDSDSDDSSSDISASDAGTGEKPVYDTTGQRLPSESHRFTLGSTCKANAQVAHTLHHWRYHLYSWVKDYLAREGHLTAEKLVKRENWSDRKRDKAARKIVNAMESGGEIKKLYSLYRDQVKFAVEAVNDYKRGWGRR